jgi:hypothetical protein
MADSPITGGLSRLESGGGGQGDFSVLCWLLAVGCWSWVGCQFRVCSRSSGGHLNLVI